MSLSIQFYLCGSGQEDSGKQVSDPGQFHGSLIKLRVLSLMYTNYSRIDFNDLFNGMFVFASLLCRRWRRGSTILKHSFEQERLVRLILISSGPQRHTNSIANHTEKHTRTGEVGCPPTPPPTPREETHSS